MIEATWNTDLRSVFGSLLRRVTNKQLMARLGALAKLRIAARLSRGVDIEGRTFTPYGEAWRGKRREKGRQASTVDLNWSGRMWAALQQTTENDSVQLFFTGEAAARAHGHQFGHRPGGLPQREFFGVNDEDEDALGDEVVKALRRG